MTVQSRIWSSAIALFSLACALFASWSLFATPNRRESPRNVAVIMCLTCGVPALASWLALLERRWPLALAAIFSVMLFFVTFWWPYALSTGALVLAALVRFADEL